MGSVWHCVSVVHGPHVLAVTTPQMLPVGQFASLWQLPIVHVPAFVPEHDGDGCFEFGHDSPFVRSTMR